MNIKQAVLPGVATLTLALSSATSALDLPKKISTCLDLASEFNAFVENDFTARTTDSQGRIAVGGDFNVSNYGVASSVYVAPENYSLVVGGDITISHGQVYTGSVVTGGDTSGMDFGSFQLADPAARIDANTTPSIDFAAEFARLDEFSQSLTELPVTGTINYQSWGGMYLSGDCSSDVQVFNIDGEDLQSSVVFSLECVPADATVIFNIDGTDVGMSNMGLSSVASHASKILYNFHEATNVEFSSIGIEGSILAPKADANTSWGYVNGTVVTKSWTGPMELHHVPFSGCLALPTNTAPVIGNTTPETDLTVGEDYVYDAQATDADGDFINYILLTYPTAEGASISLDGIVTWTPQAGQEGEYEVFVIIQDDFGGRDILQYFMTVN